MVLDYTLASLSRYEGIRTLAKLSFVSEQSESQPNSCSRKPCLTFDRIDYV